MKDFVSIAVYPATRKRLRQIAALCDEQLCDVVERLAKQELETEKANDEGYAQRQASTALVLD